MYVITEHKYGSLIMSTELLQLQQKQECQLPEFGSSQVNSRIAMIIVTEIVLVEPMLHDHPFMCIGYTAGIVCIVHHWSYVTTENCIKFHQISIHAKNSINLTSLWNEGKILYSLRSNFLYIKLAKQEMRNLRNVSCFRVFIFWCLHFSLKACLV